MNERGPGSGSCPWPGPSSCERATGSGPALSAWEADVLPLHYTLRGAQQIQEAAREEGRPRERIGHVTGTALDERTRPRLGIMSLAWAFVMRAGDGNRTRAISLGS